MPLGVGAVGVGDGVAVGVGALAWIHRSTIW
jgi:hypothetical protein